MQCDNCGYIFFQPSKKCACCSAPYVSAQSAFDVGQENLFTVFEMAPGEGGIPGGMGVTEATTGGEDYNFTDDFDTGGTEYGVDENVLDLSDAEAEGFGIPAAGPMGGDDFEFDTSGMDDMPSGKDAGDNFDLNLSDSLPDNETVSTETLEPAVETDNVGEMDFTGGFDEVEGLGFGFDESPAEETLEGATEEISLDTPSEPEISLEPELELSEEEPSIEMSEEPSLELADDPALDIEEMDATEEDPSLELLEDLELSEEPELMDASMDEPELMDASMDESAETEDAGGIDFDLDSVDLDVPEEVSYEVPEADEESEAEAGGEAPFMDLDDLELEMETPEEPEDEDLQQ
jgi:hypothetical protein